ncbi:MAG: hypothetical protein EWV89_03300 [Microcystis wesenbergii Mw_QC_B_20070930_S4]|uniref:Uncharacterized protein n=1 Tax=Microcystis aeruginosa Ma_SC_T_19800800_S464 TaxID=2486257 RepID=A0A552DIB2_MICAE|nr:MAG: hypothetical protein EWV81_19135 [Microcystis aeruginosa Ma_SC_T_19800800_S464]TRU95767.1 MAG: hypothetical protein EWV73_19800 [Microcystis wesenbergii Mw_QC_B_20070930_S4D]TRV17143.1 MAG: hypothetical protein EWV89_03300 [Microcystis wesenbergii Mw_QC_B_20070930_S4]
MLEAIMKLNIAFLIQKRYISDPEQLNQQRFKCAAQMREPLYFVRSPRKNNRRDKTTQGSYRSAIGRV